MRKQLLTVNKKDEVIAMGSQRKCHAGVGLLHRALTIFIFDKRNNLLITKRSKNKKLWPEIWETSCSTHVHKGESYIQAGEKRLIKELGFSCELKFLFKFQYQARYKDIGSENEICALLIGRYNGDILLNPQEVMEYKLIVIDKLQKEINKYPKKYAPWFKIALKKYLEYRKEKRVLKKSQYQLRLKYFETLKETSRLIDPYVKNFIKTHVKLSNELKSLILKRFRFGKAKLRPAQIRLAYELVGGNHWTKTIPACAAIEVSDTSYYCADDVFDEAVKAKSMYIIGNILSSMSHSMMIEVAPLVKKEDFQEIMKTLSKLDTDIHQGFYLDLNMTGKTDKRYYMKKAYAYNYWEHIFKIGAILGSATKDETIKMAEIGKNIGIAYTIANDTCDFGKPKCGDFALGKRTLPILFALKNSSTGDKKFLRTLIGKGTFAKEEIDQIRKIMLKSGAIDYGKSKAAGYCKTALSILETFPNSEAKELLKFSMTMTQRNKYYDILEKYRK